MSRVKIEDVSVRIPVFEATGLRLLRMPSFGRAKVGTRNISHAGALFIIHALSNIDLELDASSATTAPARRRCCDSSQAFIRPRAAA
jgi:hypothetical protein